MVVVCQVVWWLIFVFVELSSTILFRYLERIFKKSRSFTLLSLMLFVSSIILFRYIERIFKNIVHSPCFPLCFSFSSSHQWWSYLKVRTNLDAFSGPPVSFHLWIFVLKRPKSKIQDTTDDLVRCGL